MNISVIVPVLNEEKTIAATLEALLALAPYEIIIADGGSADRTCELAAQFQVKVISSERGRARQMNRGAGEGSGDVLLFLHADTRLPISALNDISAALSEPRYLDLWKRLPSDPTDPEVRRNIAITQPLLWLK